MKKPRLILTMSPYLKGKVEELSEEYGCSQAEVIRMALIRMAGDHE